MLGKEIDAKQEIEKLKPFTLNTFILVEGKKVSFEKLANDMLNQFKCK